MKKILLFLLLVSFSTEAQIINFTDANFKMKLLAASSTNYIARDINNQSIKVDINNDGEIQESEAALVYSLNVSNSNISIIEGIQYFTNLYNLDFRFNSISSIQQVMSLTNLVYLDVSSNTISSIDFTDNNFLYTINSNSIYGYFSLLCSDNPLIDLNLIGLVNMFNFSCSYNNFLPSLNFANLNSVNYFECKENNLLEEIDFGNVSFEGSDDVTISYNPILTELNINIGFTSYLYIENNNSLNSLTVNLLGEGGLNVFYLKDNPSLESLTINKLNTGTPTQYLESLEFSGNLNLNNLNFNTISNDKFNIYIINFNSSQLESLDFSNIDFDSLYLFNHEQLETLNLKNGNYVASVHFGIDGNQNLTYVCANDWDVNLLNEIFNYQSDIVSVNSYCSFVPGGEFFTIQGNSKLDIAGNGCDENDTDYPNMKFNITNGTISGSVISNTSGDYTIPVQAGTHTVTPVFENPTYYNATPANVTVAFPAETSPFIQNFCITPNGTHQDVEVVIVPLNVAVPGFDTRYKIIYRNKGNTYVSGSITMSFLDDVMDFVSSTPEQLSQVPSSVSWNYNDLMPFETRTIQVIFNLNSPQETPALNDGDILEFITLIDPTNTDEMQSDNTSTLNQNVVNSLDPNDKSCLEGSVVSTELIGQYVHYVIRFENTGSFFAQNVVVKDEIDLNKYEISSLIPLHASHDYFTRITDNKVEFIFENIQLPFPPSEERHGYIAFKIKLKNNLVVGDTFSNFASIYFDYNFPIITEPATTSIETLSSPDFEFSSYLKLYPNPANSILTLESQSNFSLKSVEIFTNLGQLVMAIPNENNQLKIDVSTLQSGIYFIKVHSDKGVGVSKFIKQ